MYNDFQTHLKKHGEIGIVEGVNHPIVTVSGLPNIHPEEIVVFEDGTQGQVFSIYQDTVEILVYSNTPQAVGAKITRTSDVLKIPVGDFLRGRTVSGLGQLDGVDTANEELRSIHTVPPGIDARAKITRPFITGVTMVDLLIPLGKGQRELIIGDRKTGKTQFLLQTMLTQAQEGTLCIYTGIGKKKSEIKRIESFLETRGIRDRTIMVTSTSADPIGLIYLTPYTAMTIAEYFKDQGQDVCLILDDLTTHAKFYREISLLAGRFPGRSSYPGDMFYTHARLLERAGNFKQPNDVEAAITCLPIADTVEGNISGYIQTNLMSITDGHIFFDTDLFTQGRRPAVNYFLSVTRVGRQTQSTIRWGINRELNTFLGFLDKTESFVHFGAELNEGITTLLSMGEKINSFFNQHMNVVLPINLQVILFSMIWVGTWQTTDKGTMNSDIQQIMNKYERDETYRNYLLGIINEANDFNDLLGKISRANTQIVQQAKT